MPRRFHLLLAACLGLQALLAETSRGYIADDRWTATASNGSLGAVSQSPPTPGVPATLTWSFVPDGTSVPGNSGPAIPSNLIGFLDTTFGAGAGGSDYTLRPWFPIFQESYDRMGALSGVTYVYEPHDDGIALSQLSSAGGLLGVRGDIRLSGKTYGAGSNILASSYGPDYSDMMINTDKGSTFAQKFNNYVTLRNTLMHESMHGLGIQHVDSNTSNFLIEPILGTSFDGPQLDDLLAIQRLYGDVYEKNGGNDSSAKATTLGAISPAQPKSLGALGNNVVITAAQTDFLSIDDDSDTDYFSFTISNPYDVQLSIVPHGATYSVGPQDGAQSSVNTTAFSNLSLALVGPNGFTAIQTADVNGIGLGETILRDLDPGTYYARVKGAQNDIQLYGISVSATASGSDNLNWVGNASSSWDVNSTANFDNGVSSDVFRTGDNVTFGAAGHIHNVFIQSNVSPTSITASDGTYTLGGSGHIVAGSLTVLGGADLTLANSGNSYSGPTTVTNGTLRITGDANAMVSPITIAAGGTVFLDPADAASMGSTIDVQTGGMLEVNSSRQLPAKLTLSGDGGGNGALRIGAGAQPTFSGNVAIPASATISIASDAMATFSGSVAGSSASVLTLDVQNGGQAQFTSDVSMGAGGIVKSGGGAIQLLSEYASTGLSHVEGGTLEAGSSGQLAGEFRVDDGAQLLVAEGASFTSTATLSGDGTVVGDFAFPGTLAPGGPIGRLTIAGNLSLTAESHVTLELGGLVPAAQYDQLQITAGAALDGTLEVLLANGFSPAAGNSFALIADSLVSQEFATVVLPQLGPGLNWDLMYLANEVLLSVSAVPVSAPADFDVDGDVDAADLAVWQSNFGLATAMRSQGDADRDGVVDGADFLAWQSQLIGAATAAATAPVPEPAGAAQGLVAAAIVAVSFNLNRQRPRA